VPLILKNPKYRKMFAKTKEIAERYLNQKQKTLIICHGDGDGVSSGVLTYIALWKHGCSVEYVITRELTQHTFTQINEKYNDENCERIIFCDIGAGKEKEIAKQYPNYLILDHHGPQLDHSQRQLNPIHYNINDLTECSGSVTAYLAIYHLFDEHFWTTRWGKWITALAVLGAVADLQNIKYGRLIGLNREILKFAKQIRTIEYKIDIGFYGRYTRPIPVAIAYHSPKLPEPLNNVTKCAAWLKKQGIQLTEERHNGSYWRRMVDLSGEEKRHLLDIIKKHLKETVEPETLQEYLESLINEIYDITIFEETELKKFSLDPREIATFLNSCTRQGDNETAFNLLFAAYDAVEKAAKHYKTYKGIIREALEAVREGLIEPKYYKNFVFYNYGNLINEKTTGIIATNLLKQKISKEQKPHVVAALHTDPKMHGMLKISFRAPLNYQEFKNKQGKQLNIGVFFQQLREKLKQIDPRIDGGGHKTAAAITILTKILKTVLEQLDKYLNQYINIEGATS